MKNVIKFILGFIIGSELALIAGYAQADISNPHPTPPANSVTATMIVNNTITANKLSSTDAFTFASSTSIQANAGNIAATGTLTVWGNTILNGVSYHWPSTGGTINQTIQTDGSNNLSFATPINTPSLGMFFGSGSDGSYTLDGSQAAVSGLFSKSGNYYTLLRNAYFTSITISTNVTLQEGGFQLYAQSSFTDNGTTTNNGGAGTKGADSIDSGHGAAGGAGGAAGAGGYFPAPPAGGAGGAGSSGGNGTAGTNGTAVNPCAGVVGAAGGAGGNFFNAAGAAGSAGTCTSEASSMFDPSTTLPLTLTNGSTVQATSTRRAIQGATSGATYSTSAGSGGGGGGGCGGGQGAGGGGGGGGTAGDISIWSPVIVVGSGATISANGGNGGNGGIGTGGGGCGAGGGGGGSGGVVVLGFGTLTNSGTISAAGGSGGTDGQSFSPSNAASPGASGTTGKIFKVSINF